MNCKYCNTDSDILNNPIVGYVCIQCLHHKPKKKPNKLKKYQGYKIVYTDASWVQSNIWGIAFYSQDSYSHDSKFDIGTNIVKSTSSNRAESKAMIFAMKMFYDFSHVHYRTDCQHVYDKLTNKYHHPCDELRKIFDEHPNWIIEEIHSSQNKAHKPSRSIANLERNRLVPLSPYF